MTGSASRERPTPRYKTPAGIAYAKTLRAKRLGLIEADMVPSRTSIGRRGYDLAYREKHPDRMKIYHARRRQQRAAAKVLVEGDPRSAAFIRAALQHPDCPASENDRWQFAWLKMMERTGLVLPPELKRLFG